MPTYKYIEVSKDDETYNGKPFFIIHNKKSSAILGNVHWFYGWNCYVSEFERDCIFSVSCLRDVIDFMENHTKA